MQNKLILSSLVTMALASSGFSAVLTGTLNPAPGTNVNLTASGTLDWAIWNSPTTPLASRAPTNRKSGGPNPFSNITAVGAGNVQGVTIGSPLLYSYTNGISPVSLSNSTQSFVMNSGTDTVGRGVQLSITGDPTKLYQVNLWTAGFNATGTLTATLSGATTYSVSHTYGDPKSAALYSFLFQPNSVTDLLLIQNVLTADNGATAQVGIQAVSISVVPEPGSVILLAGGIGLLLVSRRARRPSGC